MSLSTNRIYLALLLLTTLISCEKPKEIGLNLQGNNQLGTYFDNKQPVAAATVIHADSILAFKSSPILVGKLTDPDLGTVTAAHYSEIALNAPAAFNVDANAPADSLVLILAYTGYYYGDTTASVTLNVYHLIENFSDTKTYFTTSKLNSGALLGSITFKPKYHRRKKPGGTAEFSTTLRIKLDKAFATQLLNNTNALGSQAAFRNFWKGIAIVPDAGMNGSVIGFSTLPDSAGKTMGRGAGGINLYFKNKTGDRKFHNFGLSGYYFNEIKGTPPAGLETGNGAFVQQNTGIRTRITFPELTKFKEQNPGIVINYAELILPVKPVSTAKNPVYTLPAAIYLYESTTNKRIRKTSGGVSYSIQRGNSSVNGFSNPSRIAYNADSSFYKADITAYVQGLITEKKANNGIIVSGIAEDAFTANTSGVGYPGIVSVNRAAFRTSGAKSLQLRIYYSKIN